MTKVSVVVPVYNGGDAFRACLGSVLACSPQADEVIVVSDGSTDDSAQTAESLGARVVRLTKQGGPSRARNEGVRAASGDLVLFVDADVSVPPDTVARVKAIFEADPELDAAFGSYDDRPADPGFASQYRNLLHHFVHQTSRSEASTFWTGLGAVRRGAFLDVGGFNEERRWLEDVELGYRLKAAGRRIRLERTLFGKHHKRWTLWSMLRTDVLHRAVPWTRLIWEYGQFPNDLNLRGSSRVSAGLVLGVLLLAVFTPFLDGVGRILALAGAAAAALGVVGLNRDLYSFFRRARGAGFAAGAALAHAAYFLYSSATFVLYGGALALIGARRRSGAPPLLARSPRLALLAVLGVNAVLTLYTAVWTLRVYPNAGDEYAYLVSAELFSYGRLSVPSPFLPRFFDHFHVINDGQFYGKYPPGWPAVLTLGVLAQAPWIINPILSVLTLLLVYAIARRHFPGATSTWVLLLLLGNAFFIFNSASHFSHTSCLFFVTLSHFGFLNWTDNPSSRRDAFVAGLGAGMAVLIRPFTAVLLLLPAGIAMIALAWKRKRWNSLLAAAAPLVAAALIFLLYNWSLTGDPLQLPFTKYAAVDRPRVPASGQEALRGLSTFVGLRAAQLAWPWLPLCWLPVLLVFIHRSTGGNRKALLLLASTALLFVGYGFYPFTGGIGYGPRYCYEVVGGLALLMGFGCAQFPRLGLPFLLCTLVVNGVHFASFTRTTAEEIRDKTALFDAVEREQLTNAIVFLKTGSGKAHPGDLARNGIHFDGPVLYVRDRGAANVDLLRAFPERTAYVYKWDGAECRGTLTPFELDPDPAEARLKGGP